MCMDASPGSAASECPLETTFSAPSPLHRLVQLQHAIAFVFLCRGYPWGFSTRLPLTALSIQTSQSAYHVPLEYYVLPLPLPGRCRPLPTQRKDLPLPSFCSVRMVKPRCVLIHFLPRI